MDADSCVGDTTNNVCDSPAGLTVHGGHVQHVQWVFPDLDTPLVITRQQQPAVVAVAHASDRRRIVRLQDRAGRDTPSRECRDL